MEGSWINSLWFLNHCPLNPDSARSPLPVTGHSATAPAWLQNGWRPAGSTCGGIAGEQHSITGPRDTDVIWDTRDVFEWGMGKEGQWQRFWHGGAVMGWDSKPAATNRFLMRCPIKNTGRWTLMTTAKLVCSFMAPFSIRLGWGTWHVWPRSNWDFLPSQTWMYFGLPFL